MKSICDIILFLMLCALTCAIGSSSFARSHLHHRSRSAARHHDVKSVRVDENGALHAMNMEKISLSKEISLSLRDLRLFDSSSSHSTLAFRPDAILFALEHVKVCINYNQAIVFGIENEASQELMLALQRRIQSTRSSSSSVRFEHAVLDVALTTVCDSLARHADHLQSTARLLRKDHRESGLISHKHGVKQELEAFHQRIKEVQRVITEVLNDDTALHQMHLSKIDIVKHAKSTKVVDVGANQGAPGVTNIATKLPEADNDEPDRFERSTVLLELMLEEHLHKLGLLSLSISTLLDEIDVTEIETAIQRERTHQRRLRFELTLSMCSFVVSCAALVTGVFGMNLLSHVEHQPAMFSAVTLSLIVGMFLTYGKLSSYGRQEQLF
eukprot:gene12399-14349_t